MYFLNIKKLKDHLAQNGLTNFQAFIYFFLYTIIYEIEVLFPLEKVNIWDKLDSYSTIIIAILGILYCYLMNGGEKGVAFVGRFLSISIVMALRFMIAMIFPMLALAWLFNFDPSTWYGVLLFSSIGILYYRLVGHHLRDVARRTTMAPTALAPEMADTAHLPPTS